MDKEIFEMCFELEDIISVEDNGYENMYDICVSGDHTFILGNGIVSHNSAFGGLSPVLGRKECGYYILRGKPLNAYSAAQSKFTENKELSELYKIIQNENYQYIVFATDQDLDGCLTGETKIPLLDGREVQIKDLVNEEEFWVYSYDEQGNVHPGRGFNARITKYVDVIYKIELSNGKIIEVTDNHPFMLRNGEFKKARDLIVGESLMPTIDNKYFSELFSIKSIEIIKLDEKIPVYDIEVEKYHNFATCSGAIVHNSHIRGLLSGFFHKYMPELKNNIAILQTPVIEITKNDKVTNWYYNLTDEVKLRAGETANYKKGLGSWNSDDLKYIVQKDGLENMIEILEFNSDQILEEWLGNDSEPRKKYILENDFSIAKL